MADDLLPIGYTFTSRYFGDCEVIGYGTMPSEKPPEDRPIDYQVRTSDGAVHVMTSELIEDTTISPPADLAG